MCENCKETQTQFANAETAIDLALMAPIIEKYGKIKGSLINILQEIHYIYF